jgi:hypothetical protein
VDDESESDDGYSADTELWQWCGTGAGLEESIETIK